MSGMKSILIPERYNYIGVFLTFACQLRCPYCINHERGFNPSYTALTGAEWVAALNRLQTRPDLPITLQGGEPTLHPEFYKIVKGLRRDIKIDLLTNLQFDIDEFSFHLPPLRLARPAPYASIRVSYHPPTMSLEKTVKDVKTLLKRGYFIGVWIVNHPADKLIKVYQQAFIDEGIDCRLKEYLDGGDYGTYLYKEFQGKKGMVCRPSEMLVAPDGGIFRCHGDLYNNKKAYANIRDSEVALVDGFVPCKKVACSACDIKIKFNRFQQIGHCAVEIKSP